MRVLQIITKGELGGAQTHVAELCRALCHRHEFMALVGGAAGSPLGDQLAALDIPVVPIPGMDNRMDVPGVVATVRRLAKAARTWEADVVHVHSAVAAALGRMAGALAGKPVAYTVHGFGFKPQVPALRRMGAWLGERALAPLSGHVICVSPAERELALRIGLRDRQVSVIANGLSDVPWSAHPEREPAALVMVARMSAPKRHDLLLQALAVLRGRGVGLPRTVLAGGGPLLPQVARMAAQEQLSCVNLAGDLPDVPRQLADSQVFVLLSDHEGQPISVVEAMRAGLPIVASDLPGIRSQIGHGQEGLLTPNDPQRIADAIERLLRDPPLRKRMGQAARRRYELEFSVQTMAHRVEQVYASLADPRARPSMTESLGWKELR